jgi:predicted acyl esterase
MKRLIGVMLAALLAACGGGGTDPAPAVAAPDGETPNVVQAVKFQASDGALLHAFVGGVGDLSPRPLIVEFSPYAPACCGPFFGAAYNYVQVHARGTGLSTGVWGAVGPRDQQDIAEFLDWACRQPWSNGHIGLYGFSASAIAIYNSLHLPLACVDAASLMAGTADLYRDLLYPGGMPNSAPAAVVGFGVGAPLLQNSPGATRDGESPIDRTLSGLGLLELFVDVLAHTVEDDYWIGRTQRPGPNRFPVLADTSFYDPEPRGPFESYKLLRDAGVPVHLLLFGAHDGFPATTPGPFPQYRRWFDHYLLGLDNGVDRDPKVQMLVGNGSFDALKSGDLTHIDASDWPVPGTRWQPLYLDAMRGGGANSINDGTLGDRPAEAQSTQAYPAITSLPTATDPHTTGTVAAAGAASLFDALPVLTQLALVEPTALTWTAPALSEAVNVVGPASLDLFAATVTTEGDLYAVLADVWPDGRAHAVGVGRLRSSFPNVVAERAVFDAQGEMVQPYGDFSAKTPGLPAQMREYHIEFWPIGNRFLPGHRVRLYLVGASGFMLPSPGVNLVSIGGATPSRLLLPVIP